MSAANSRSNSACSARSRAKIDAAKSTEYSTLFGFPVDAGRLRIMRYTASACGKSVPNLQQLLDLLSDIGAAFKCPHCRRKMTWTKKESATRVITLQHDASGSFRLICQSCNSRHGLLPGDKFYDIPSGHRYCNGCRTVKPIDEFYKDNSGRPSGCSSRCRLCQKERARGWRANNLDRARLQDRKRTDRERAERVAAHGRGDLRTVLTASIVRRIRQLAAAGDSQRKLSAEFSLSPSQIANIVHRRHWAHVD